MKVKELMTGITPSKTFEGIANTDDFVLAIDITGPAEDGTPTAVDDYEVVQGAVAGVDAQLSAETSDKTYIREGKSTSKTSTQRTFAVTGDRKHGAAFQDFCFSHAIKFGTGAKVVRDYVFFSMLTGEGEKGEASIIVNSDGGGDAGNTAAFDVNIQATKIPEAYTYTAASNASVQTASAKSKGEVTV